MDRSKFYFKLDEQMMDIKFLKFWDCNKQNLKSVIIRGKFQTLLYNAGCDTPKS